MTSLAIALLALQFVPGMPVSVHRVELVPESAVDEPVAISLPRDERLDLEITVVAEDVSTDVESLEIVAENQMEGYWAHRHPPNLFVKIERLGLDGTHQAARARVIYSGAGKSLREHHVSVQIDIQDTPEKRAARIREFFEKGVPRGTLSAASVEAGIQYIEPGYVGNPQGKYRFQFEYKPAAGAFAGRVLHRTLIVDVSDGPDTVDRLLASH